MTNKNIFTSVIILAIIIVIAGVGANFNSDNNKSVNEGSLATTTISTSTAVATGTLETSLTPMDIFAKCVAQNEFTMYGAVSCSHCLNEKNSFGSSFKYVPYVECLDNIKLCQAKDIVGFPTWIDKNGKKYEGEQGLTNISRITGCALPAGK